ncbi:MAG TPA: SusC/RagA family TonB-linked outer membrane protein, partial [Chitinophagaceae bacterium]|nr:SusC/RagA family TonB-linked outer membrane protein [Chitinophagaceae bacterium]
MRKVLLLLGTLFLIGTSAFAQNRQLTGRVIDERGNGLANASITIKGTNSGTTTNSEGSFALSVPNTAQALVVSFIGLGEKEIPITRTDSYTITLSSTTKDLQEVVVVGYGTQRRANLTSSVGTVKGEDIENKPFTSVDQILQGKVAGMQVPTGTGQPGAAQPIRIRGIGSHTAGASPLYVIDGVIINSGDLSRNTTSANALAGINPNDVESVNVLKDAQATSIYGSRGSNGVVVITTKRGRAGKTKFRVDAEVGSNTYADLPSSGRFLNADEWLNLVGEGLKNAGRTQAQIDATLTSFGKGTGVNTDWLDLVTRTGKQQQYNLSASGGDAKNQFYISGGYFKQEASVIRSEFERYSFRTNFKHVANDKLNFNVILGAGNTVQHSPSTGGTFANPVGAVGFLRPTQNPYNADGSYNISITGGTNFNSGVYNPLYIANNDRNDYNNALINGNLSGEYALLKNLKFTSRFGVDLNTISEYSFNNQFHGDGVSQGGIGIAADTRLFNWIVTNQFDYNTYIADKWRIDAKVGYEAQKSKTYQVTARADGFPPSNDLYLSINAATPKTGSAAASDYSFAGLYSSVNVGYNDRYILSGSFRRDGSSRFGDKYGNFWSVGAAWNIDKEDFVKDVSFLSGLKLRGSYGLTGNAAGIGNYAYRQTFAFGSNYNGLPGGTFNNVGNENLTWETQYQSNVGLDASFFKNRIALIFDYYNRTSGKLLFDRPLSRTTGFTAVT